MRDIEGYWRKQYSIESEEIIPCSISPSSCIGGSELENKLCYEGHIGPQCLNCDIKGEYWNDSYSMQNYFQCTKCSSHEKSYISLVPLKNEYVLHWKKPLSIKFAFCLCEAVAIQFLNLSDFKRHNQN
ncbi:hypothetical protein TTHERM_01099070 (macronuclear) [Tetrahymena thermophila SB210]|uniref:Transmembrane protein n=1 Tax=Tetrahymena thermophila (strain SB210) TaxID=312017 RepID=Q22BK6_TETTS|nr:hypothetical protein TTHERM_01099070 [Tetrahymena thermophila SB210]EAR82660.3 hypothetical protein TTHERM_01099070 [Tetrahymena thermophila SB210]|eukprot:XP_001030323.3 hypothetical protein TTHERM_01099070 [Tetrahymena thermophila SB210]